MKTIKKEETKLINDITELNPNNIKYIFVGNKYIKKL
jgi:hypothetical protein